VSADAFARLQVNSATFIYVFLPPLVFEAGIVTDVRRMIEDAAPILLLAIIATLLTTAVIGMALWLLAGVPLVVCLILGAAVATTDPAAVIAIFRDVGAPARLTRLVEGEALLNDAAAIALFAVLLGMIVAAREPDIGAGLREFFLSFIGGGLLGLVAGRAILWLVPWLGNDRLAEGTLTLALAYGAFIVADRLFHVSGVVAVLGSGLTISALGRSRVSPYNWSFLADLWDQIAFWARSLVFRPRRRGRKCALFWRRRHPRERAGQSLPLPVIQPNRHPNAGRPSPPIPRPPFKARRLPGRRAGVAILSADEPRHRGRRS
jgi:CPA1 family monovalent cation:H+ antiporter